MNTPKSSQFSKGPVVLVSRRIAYTFPLSYAYLAGHLKACGEEVRILFRGGDNQKLAAEIMREEPLLVGLGNLYPELAEIREIIALLDRAGRRFPVVVGGQMVSPTPEFAVRITGADYGVIGEGELILADLVRALRNGGDTRAVKGLAVREGDDIVLTGPGEYIQDLSTLPRIPYELFPTREWLDVGRWYAENAPQPHWRFDDKVINVHGGRGCPFNCNFCYHHSRPRYRPMDIMMDEAAEALDRFGGTMLYFSDDLVLSSPARARQLVDGVRGLRRPVSYSGSARFDTLARMDDSLLAEMKASGCRMMGLGIESGSDRILNVIGKNCTANSMRTELSRLHKAGILATGNIMLGQYTETREEVGESIRFVQETIREDPNLQYAFSLTTPFPGSKLYGTIFVNNILRDDQEFYERYFSPSRDGDWNLVVNLSAMPDKEVGELFKEIQCCYKKAKADTAGRRAVFLDSARIALGKGRRLLERSARRPVAPRLFAWAHRRMEYASLKVRGVC